MSKIYFIANSLLSSMYMWFIYTLPIKENVDSQLENGYVPINNGVYYDSIKGRHKANCCGRKVIELSDILKFGIFNDKVDGGDCVIKTPYALYDSEFSNKTTKELLNDIKLNHGIQHTNTE